MEDSQTTTENEPEVIPEPFRARVFALFLQSGICRGGDWFDHENARRLIGKQGFTIPQLRWAFMLEREYVRP